MVSCDCLIETFPDFFFLLYFFPFAPIPLIKPIVTNVAGSYGFGVDPITPSEDDFVECSR